MFIWNHIFSLLNDTSTPKFSHPLYLYNFIYNDPDIQLLNTINSFIYFICVYIYWYVDLVVIWLDPRTNDHYFWLRLIKFDFSLQNHPKIHLVCKLLFEYFDRTLYSGGSYQYFQQTTGFHKSTPLLIPNFNPRLGRRRGVRYTGPHTV